MIKQWIWPLVFFLLLGFFLGRYQGFVPSDTKSDKKVGLLCPYLDPIICAEIEKYKIEKEQETKYQIAQNILSKMIKIFLADLGLRVADKNFQLEQYVKSKKSARSEYVDHTDLKETLPEPTPRPTSTPKITEAAASEPPVEKRLSLRELRNLERQVKETRNRSFLRDTLAKLLPEDAGALIFYSQPVSRAPEVVEDLEGEYEGWIRMAEKRIKDWRVKLTVKRDSAANQKLTGEYQLELRSDGDKEPFLATSGKGNFKDVRLPRGASQAILLKANDDLYFQVYITRGGLNGNVFARPKDQFGYIGRIELAWKKGS